MELLSEIHEALKSGKLLPDAASNLKDWLQETSLPPWGRQALTELIKRKAWDELNNRFYKWITLGTGGMRARTIGKINASGEGIGGHAAVGTNYLNDITVVRATIGLFQYCQAYRRVHEKCSLRLVVAHDVRYFSRHFSELTASVWTNMGGEAFLFDGPRSTPQLSFTVRHLRAIVGVVITASHNPPHDNGYKVYFQDGAQVVSPHAEGIIAAVHQIECGEVTRFLEKNREEVFILSRSVDDAYFASLQKEVIDPALLQRSDLKAVYSSIHGTGAGVVPSLMRSFKLEPILVEEQMVMDGAFPTVSSPNPENAETLSMAIRKAEAIVADIVMATDPDDDRMGVAVRTKSGQMKILTGNQVGALLAEYRITRLKEKGFIPVEGSQRCALIKTFVTTPLQEAIAKSHGIKVVNTLTGFKWIGEKLYIYEEELKKNLLCAEGVVINYNACSREKRRHLLQQYSTYFVFGGEESCGYLASDDVRDKDGNAAVIMFCELAAYLRERNLTAQEYLDALYVKHGYFLERLLNIYYEGAAGTVKIRKMLDSLREDPLKEIDGVLVDSCRDFGSDDIYDEDGRLIAKENFFLFMLSNGYSIGVRGSGTEPKIKFYLFARESVESVALLEDVKSLTEERMKSLQCALEIEMQRRARE